MVTVEVPVGVPGLCWTCEPPPPHELKPAANASTPRSKKTGRRRFFPAARPPKIAKPKIPKVALRPELKPVAGGAAVGAVVVMVSVVEPLVDTVVGLNEQAASDGSPEVQLKLTAPVKPFVAATLRVYVAD
jgi:hypothetical protein